MRLACFRPRWGYQVQSSISRKATLSHLSRSGAHNCAPITSRGQFAAFRLKPGEDLIAGLHQARQQSNTRAMAVVTCVGSLTSVWIRHANRPEGTLYRGHFEITSLAGTIDGEGEHLHLTITNGEGHAFGGHLLPGSSIYTTAEIVTVILPDMAFTREPCVLSGYDELVVTPVPKSERAIE